MFERNQKPFEGLRSFFFSSPPTIYGFFFGEKFNFLCHYKVSQVSELQDRNFFALENKLECFHGVVSITNEAEITRVEENFIVRLLALHFNNGRG